MYFSIEHIEHYRATLRVEGEKLFVFGIDDVSLNTLVDFFSIIIEKIGYSVELIETRGVAGGVIHLYKIREAEPNANSAKSIQVTVLDNDEDTGISFESALDGVEMYLRAARETHQTGKENAFLLKALKELIQFLSFSKYANAQSIILSMMQYGPAGMKIELLD